MKKAMIAVGALAIVLVLFSLTLLFIASHRDPKREFVPVAASSPANTPSTVAGAGEVQPGFLYGRVTTDAGVTYEGRLRWGGDQEAFWGDYFNGVKRENPWIAQVTTEQRPKERTRLEIFGFEIARRERPLEVRRLFMARFGDIARVEPQGRDVQVTLKSGTVFKLNRFDASDFDDGVRVWDVKQGVVNLDSGQIRTIELLPTAPLADAPSRLHGTVRTRQGEFTGYVQWDRNDCVGSDELHGKTADGELSVRFDTVRSIARRSKESSLVTLLDGREIVLSGTREVGRDNLGIYVDDRRYGRVLISWDAFERIDFSPGGSGPAYGDFPPGGRSPGASKPATAAGSPAGWSTTWTRARPPTRSMLLRRAWTTPFRSAWSPRSCCREAKSATPSAPGCASTTGRSCSSSEPAISARGMQGC
jgi:hypothetical protein